MRPVLAGACAYESLVNGALDLEDIARINDALDIQAENEARYHHELKSRQNDT